jgi:plasmid stability protein
MPDKPRFDKIVSLDEEALRARLEVVRAALTHASEKGRSLEAATTDVLRSMLPSEYGLSTGFIASHGTEGAELSTQLDVIIYDALRSGPLVRLGSCDVFPLEAVYGYVEVKAALRSCNDLQNPTADSLEACIKTNSKLRQLTKRRYWEPAPGSGVQAIQREYDWMTIRSFVVSFDVTGSIKDPAVFASRMAEVLAHFGGDTHLHGVLVLGNGFYRSRPVDNPNDRYHVEYTSESPLGAFRDQLLMAMQRFPRFAAAASPALDQYYSSRRWLSAAPPGAT